MELTVSLRVPGFKVNGCLSFNASIPTADCLKTLKQVAGNAEGGGHPDASILTMYQQRGGEKSLRMCVQRTISGDSLGILSWLQRAAHPRVCQGGMTGPQGFCPGRSWLRGAGEVPTSVQGSQHRLRQDQPSCPLFGYQQRWL